MITQDISEFFEDIRNAWVDDPDHVLSRTDRLRLMVGGWVAGNKATAHVKDFWLEVGAERSKKEQRTSKKRHLRV